MKSTERHGGEYRNPRHQDRKEFKRNTDRELLVMVNGALIDGLAMLTWIFYALLTIGVIAAAGLVGVVAYLIL